MLVGAKPLRPPPVLVVHRGRPRNAAPSTSVSTWLTSVDHDKLIALANEQEVSISALVRSLLKLRLR